MISAGGLASCPTLEQPNRRICRKYRNPPTPITVMSVIRAGTEHVTATPPLPIDDQRH